MTGEAIDARQSQGAITNPHADIDQHFGDQQNIETGGGDSAGGNLDKRTIVNYVFNIGREASKSLSQASSTQDLLRLLTQIGDLESVGQAYRETLPVDSYLSRPEATKHTDMVAQLQEFRRLLEFAERLAGDPQISPLVREQLKDFIQKLEQSEQRHQPSTVQIVSQIALQSYLQIVLRPNLSSDRFVVNAWLIPDESVYDPAKRFQLLDLDEQQKGISCKLEQVPDILDRFLKRSLNFLKGKRYDLTIEVFLPLDHLCAEVDGWKLTDNLFDEDEQFLIGTRYRVVVRSLERLDPKYLISERMNQWYANWNRVKTCGHQAPSNDDFEHLERLTMCNWKQLEYALRKKLGLKLTCGLAETQHKELFKCILKAAVPIAIWVRCDLPHLDQVSEISNLLLAEPLLALSESVWKKRQAADMEDNPAEHLGSHLALLWEDPYRLTPDAMAQLIPPGQ